MSESNETAPVEAAPAEAAPAEAAAAAEGCKRTFDLDERTFDFHEHTFDLDERTFDLDSKWLHKSIEFAMANNKWAVGNKHTFDLFTKTHI